MSKVYHAHKQGAYQLPLFPVQVCKTCGVEKFLDAFPWRKDTNKYRPDCKECIKQQKQEYQSAHREQIRENKRAYAESHREQLKQYKRWYYTTHREHYRQKSKERQITHREQIRQYHHEYYANHREQLKQKNKEYAVTHREAIRLSQRRKYLAHREEYRTFRIAHPELIRQRNRAWLQANPLKGRERQRRRYARKRNTPTSPVSYKRILERDGMHCYICDKPIEPHHALHFDHVIPLFRGGAHSEENIKPTHAQCNLRKSFRLLSEMDAFDRRGVDG